MITLDDNGLSFAFPEIPNQLRSCLERHLRDILPAFALPPDRLDLVDQLAHLLRSSHE